jgi:hypothetical protein
MVWTLWVQVNLLPCLHYPSQEICDVILSEQTGSLRNICSGISHAFICIHIRSPSSLTTPSRTKWYARTYWFFFNVDPGTVVLHKTDWLSPNTNAGSSTKFPLILNLYRKPQTYSVACFIATNSLPNLLVSQEFCFFELQYIGALFKNTINPVLDRIDESLDLQHRSHS